MQKKKRYKRNTDDYTEQLEKENHELKSLNKQLLRRIRKLDKFYQNGDLENEQEVKDTFSNLKKKEEHCPSCHIGILNAVTVAGRTWKRCSDCDYRTKATKC